MRKSTIAMLVALSFAAVSCGEPKITNVETTEEVATEVVEVDATEEVVEAEAVK